MGVAIDHAGHDGFATGIDDVRTRRCRHTGPDRFDDAIAHEHAGLLEGKVLDVEDVAALDKNRGHGDQRGLGAKAWNRADYFILWPGFG